MDSVNLDSANWAGPAGQGARKADLLAALPCLLPLPASSGMGTAGLWRVQGCCGLRLLKDRPGGSLREGMNIAESPGTVLLLAMVLRAAQIHAEGLVSTKRFILNNLSDLKQKI